MFSFDETSLWKKVFIIETGVAVAHVFYCSIHNMFCSLQDIIRLSTGDRLQTLGVRSSHLKHKHIHYLGFLLYDEVEAFHGYCVKAVVRLPRGFWT
jgi:hypothetical protein